MKDRAAAGIVHCPEPTAMGLGYTLAEEAHFRGGVEEELRQLPNPLLLVVILVEAVNQPSQGCGEPPMVCMGTVIANAVFDATGPGPFPLPMTPARVKAAIAGG